MCKLVKPLRTLPATVPEPASDEAECSGDEGTPNYDEAPEEGLTQMEE